MKQSILKLKGIVKSGIAVDDCNVWAGRKVDMEFYDKRVIETDIGTYNIVDKDILKPSFKDIGDEGGTLFPNIDVIWSTERTAISGWTIKEIKDWCDKNNEDWNFKIFEHKNKEHPLMIINGNNTLFIIAPRIEPN